MPSINFEITKNLSPQENMDLDKQNLLEGKSILRFYSWKPAGLSLGISEEADKIVDFDKCKLNNVEIVKRLTGGAAVLHRDDFTYSIILPKEIWPKQSLHAIYDIISLALQDGLQRLGVDVQRADAKAWKMPESHVCFQGPSKNEILVNGRKIVGSAQAHKRKAILQHGSLMIKNHTAELCKLLKIHNQDNINHIVSKTIALADIPVTKNVTFDTVADAMLASFKYKFSEYDIHI